MPTGPRADGTATRVAWLSADEQDAWRAFTRLAKMLIRQLDRDLHPFGLSASDYEILVELYESPGNQLRMTELADRTAQSRSRLSHQVSRMADKGLVRREDCVGDKRGTFAVITPRGSAVIERISPTHVASVRRHFVDHLSPDQLDTMTTTFSPLLKRLSRIRDRD